MSVDRDLIERSAEYGVTRALRIARLVEESDIVPLDSETGFPDVRKMAVLSLKLAEIEREHEGFPEGDIDHTVALESLELYLRMEQRQEVI